MENKQLREIIDEILKSHKFKRKGSSWYLDGDELLKIVQLQKSKFSNAYYLNYGINLKKLDFSDFEMHIMEGLSSIDDFENLRIVDLLNLDSDIGDSERANGLKLFIEKQIVKKLSELNDEQNVLRYLKSRPHLNDIPVVVKEFFDLKAD